MKSLYWVAGIVFALLATANLLILILDRSQGDPPAGWKGALDVTSVVFYFAAAVTCFAFAIRGKKANDIAESSAAELAAAAIAASATAGTGMTRAAGESLVTVHGYTDLHFVKPKIRIFWEGTMVGTVAAKGRFTFAIVGDGDIRFASLRRSVTLRVIAGKDSHILLRWDQLSGELLALAYHSEPPEEAAEELGSASAPLSGK